MSCTFSCKVKSHRVALESVKKKQLISSNNEKKTDEKENMFTLSSRNFFIHFILSFDDYLLTLQIVYKYLPSKLIIETIDRSIIAFSIIL